MQADGHPVIEFVQSEGDVEAAHRRVEGMNFIPGGYTYTDWGAWAGGDGGGSGGGVGDAAGSSHPYGTRLSGAGDAGGASSMSVDLDAAPDFEIVHRLSPRRLMHVSPAGGVGGPPTPPDATTAMEHDGEDSSPFVSTSPMQSPSPRLMPAPGTSGQLPGSSGMSNDTASGRTGEISAMEALTLLPGAGLSHAGPEEAPVRPEPQDSRDHGEPERAAVHPEPEQAAGHAQRRSVSAPRTTKAKSQKSRASSAGRATKERGEGSRRSKKGVSPGRITEDADIPHATAADSPQESLSPAQTARRLNSVIVQNKG